MWPVKGLGPRLDGHQWKPDSLALELLAWLRSSGLLTCNDTFASTEGARETNEEMNAGRVKEKIDKDRPPRGDFCERFARQATKVLSSFADSAWCSLSVEGVQFTLLRLSKLSTSCEFKREEQSNAALHSILSLFSRSFSLNNTDQQ